MDGERGSNSLSLEKDLDWSGLLAEGDPSNVKIIKYDRELTQHSLRNMTFEFFKYTTNFVLFMPRSKHRKSFLLPHCLSLSRKTMYVTYRQDFNLGKVEKTNIESTDARLMKWGNFANVICFPLFGVLKALNVTKVDYFSLDVEGKEMDVLRTIPFDDVNITVEYCFLRALVYKNFI